MMTKWSIALDAEFVGYRSWSYLLICILLYECVDKVVLTVYLHVINDKTFITIYLYVKLCFLFSLVNSSLTPNSDLDTQLKLPELLFWSQSFNMSVKLENCFVSFELSMNHTFCLIGHGWHNYTRWHAWSGHGMNGAVKDIEWTFCWIMRILKYCHTEWVIHSPHTVVSSKSWNLKFALFFIWDL